MNLQVKEMNLFDAPEGSILVHAVNCKGVWGAGIAKSFREKFPKAHSQYVEICHADSDACLGWAQVSKDSDFLIGSLFTSNGFGQNVDSEEAILEATEEAISWLLLSVSQHYENNKCIFSNKFNSGLFGVPWEKTEEILKRQLQAYPEISWTVCDFKG